MSVKNHTFASKTEPIMVTGYIVLRASYVELSLPLLCGSYAAALHGRGKLSSRPHHAVQAFQRPPRRATQVAKQRGRAPHRRHHRHRHRRPGLVGCCEVGGARTAWPERTPRRGGRPPDRHADHHVALRFRRGGCEASTGPIHDFVERRPLIPLFRHLQLIHTQCAWRSAIVTGYS